MKVSEPSFSELLESDRDALETSLEQIADEYHNFLESQEDQYSVEISPEFKEAKAFWSDGNITRVVHSTLLFDRRDATYLEISAYKPSPSGVKSCETELAVIDMQNIASNLGFAYETVRQFTEEDMSYAQSL